MTLLETKKLCKYFMGLKAVDQVDMKVQQGEILGIIGPNGAGKTTFFNLCSCTLPVTSGEIFFCGQNITHKHAEDAAQLGIARTFQNIKLFTHMTVAENVAVGFHIQTKTNLFDAIVHTKRFKTDELLIKEKTDDILKRLELYQYKDYMASNLSYGMQRKVEIARTMALEPKILLLDEPAAGMNPNETRQLLDFVKKLNKDGYTVVVIEHDMKFIMNLCDRIIVLNYGQKICEGTPEEVKNNSQVQEAYFGKGLAAGVPAKKKEGEANAEDL